MVELKTLKDFDWGEVIRCNDCNFSADELRQEAIKWIKKLNQFYKDHPCEEWSCQASESKTMQELSKKLHVNIEHIIGCGEYKCTHQGVNLLKLWIKYFFNITEEDLMKNGKKRRREK